MQFFRDSTVENKEYFLNYCSKPDAKFISLSYPIYLSMFNEEIQWCITLSSQLLGLDTNGYITEPLLSLLFVLSTCPVKLELLRQSFSPVVLGLMSF